MGYVLLHSDWRSYGCLAMIPKDDVVLDMALRHCCGEKERMKQKRMYREKNDKMQKINMTSFVPPLPYSYIFPMHYSHADLFHLGHQIRSYVKRDGTICRYDSIRV